MNVCSDLPGGTISKPLYPLVYTAQDKSVTISVFLERKLGPRKVKVTQLANGEPNSLLPPGLSSSYHYMPHFDLLYNQSVCLPFSLPQPLFPLSPYPPLPLPFPYSSVGLCIPRTTSLRDFVTWPHSSRKPLWASVSQWIILGLRGADGEVMSQTSGLLAGWQGFPPIATALGRCL